MATTTQQETTAMTTTHPLDNLTTAHAVRGYMDFVDGDGDIIRESGWFYLTHYGTINRRKVGGRNWHYYGRVSDLRINTSFSPDPTAR